MPSGLTTPARTDLLSVAYQTLVGNDWDSALAALSVLVRNNPALVEGALTFAVKEALRAAQRRIRSQITAGGVGLPRTFSEGERSAASHAMRQYLGYMDWPMMDHTRLADADRAKCLSDANAYRRNAVGNLRNALFLEAVSKKVPEGRTVGEVLTERQLRNLMEKARAKAASVPDNRNGERE